LTIESNNESNVESKRQAWLEIGETSAGKNGVNPSRLIWRVRLRVAAAIIIASLALLASGFGLLLVGSGGFEVVEILAWSLIMATLVALIGLVIRAHGIAPTRHLPVLDHTEVALSRTIRLEGLIANLHRFFWVPMLIAFLMLAYASEYRHWTDYTFAATSIAVLIWGLIYGCDHIKTRMQADRKTLSAQIVRLRQIETDQGAS